MTATEGNARELPPATDKVGNSSPSPQNFNFSRDLHAEVRDFFPFSGFNPGCASEVLAVVIFVHTCFFVLALLPPPTDTGIPRIALLAYLGWGHLVAASVLANRPLVNRIAFLMRQRAWGKRLHGLFYLLWLLFASLSLYPVFYLVGYLAFNRAAQALAEENSGDASKIDFHQLIFTTHVQDKDVTRARQVHTAALLVMLVILAALKQFFSVTTEVSIILTLQAISVFFFMLLHISMHADLRTLAKRQRGPVAWNAAAVVAYVIATGVIGATIIDLTQISLNQGGLRHVLELSLENAKILVLPGKILGFLVGPGVTVWKGCLFVLAYFFVISEILGLKAWRNWRRNSDDWLFLAGNFFHARNSQKCLEAIRKAEELLGGSQYLPVVSLRLKGYALLDIGSEKEGRAILARLLPDVELAGDITQYWLAERAVLMDDRPQALRYLTELALENPEHTQLRFVITSLQNAQGQSKRRLHELFGGPPAAVAAGG